MKKKLCTLLIAAHLSHLSACTTLNQLTYEKEGPKQGDVLVITTATDRYDITVKSITAEEICGSEKCVRIDAIRNLQRQEFSLGRTMVLVGCVVLVAAGLFAYSTRGGMLAK